MAYKYATFRELLYWSYANMQMLAFACAAMDLPFDFRLLPRNYPHPEDSKICEPMPNFQLKMLDEIAAVEEVKK